MEISNEVSIRGQDRTLTLGAATAGLLLKYRLMLLLVF